MVIHVQTHQTLLPITSASFRKGYSLGRIAHFYVYRTDGEGELDDDYLVSNLLSYIQQGLHNDPQYFSERVGFLIGMISGNVIDKQENE